MGTIHYLTVVGAAAVILKILLARLISVGVTCVVVTVGIVVRDMGSDFVVSVDCGVGSLVVIFYLLLPTQCSMLLLRFSLIGPLYNCSCLAVG